MRQNLGDEGIRRTDMNEDSGDRSARGASRKRRNAAARCGGGGRYAATPRRAKAGHSPFITSSDPSGNAEMKLYPAEIGRIDLRPGRVGTATTSRSRHARRHARSHALIQHGNRGWW